MKRTAPLFLALLSVWLTIPSTYAQDAGALDAGLADAGAVLSAAPVAVATTPLDNPMPFVKLVFDGVKTGNWWLAAAALLVIVVSLIRLYGKKLHDKLPDNLLWDKPLYFLFDTKPGGWLLNLLTAVAGGCGTAMLSGSAVDWALVKPILMVSVSGAAVWEIVKDVWGWVQKKAVPPPAPPAPVPAPKP